MTQMAIPYKSQLQSQITTPVKPVQLLELKGNTIHLTGSIDFYISPKNPHFKGKEDLQGKQSTQNSCISPFP